MNEASESEMGFDPSNILVIDFGQLGDVVMSLPALRAIRDKFPRARITVAVGKPCADLIELSRCADETLAVDRVALRDGFKPLSVLRLLQLVRDVRRRQFDFVIDLHSLSETNLLGFLSGAPRRLYSRRPRSLDFLANFKPRPPLEADHRERHLVDRYLDVLTPLELQNAPAVPRLATRAVDDQKIERLLKKAKADIGAPLVGLFPGAGHPSRCWPLERFAELADFLIRNQGACVLVFCGPEERPLLPAMRTLFPKATLILDRLSIQELAAAQARLTVFVSNDTGPMHVAAAVGSPIVLLLDKRAPDSYLPRASQRRVIYSSTIPEISVEEVYSATRELLATARTETLFAS